MVSNDEVLVGASERLLPALRAMADRAYGLRKLVQREWIIAQLGIIANEVMEAYKSPKAAVSEIEHSVAATDNKLSKRCMAAKAVDYKSELDNLHNSLTGPHAAAEEAVGARGRPRREGDEVQGQDHGRHDRASDNSVRPCLLQVEIRNDDAAGEKEPAVTPITDPSRVEL
ncbi:uncharacterized protein IUM83_01875 [Phytophthora cinnamomi]|uniref:uncharacterized protein n=1 Tax=Phytophthora cinnamomi TaxID=4785 RepID=UPI00355954F8|nr:hypothetical protein IUM83_01875 [Phytophthora cinnamomi]